MHIECALEKHRQRRILRCTNLQMRNALVVRELNMAKKMATVSASVTSLSTAIVCLSMKTYDSTSQSHKYYSPEETWWQDSAQLDEGSTRPYQCMGWG